MKIFDIRAFTAYVECWHMPYSFLVMHGGNKRKNKNNKKKNKTDIFTDDFLNLLVEAWKHFLQ